MAQTSRTFKRDDQRPARARLRASTVLRHEMTVVAADVADVVLSAGGWLYDRSMAGWRVSVLVSDRADDRALRILGADVFDLSGDLEAITDDPDRAGTLAVSAEVYTADARVRRFVTVSDRRRAEVALWGDADALDQKVSAVRYRPSAAAQAFKAQALLAAGLSIDSVPASETLYRCGVTALAIRS
ncbi:hypothetical protein [Mycobacterium sp. 1274761.0]|uniref:hypothetical protein n=1 Tax=Mycobacterium sp. 1274761.0 TaxID=1834077 RepID=UPI0012E9698B|nr:hypothetical protein [Mycobacterium sp. 1274761.0]